MRMQITIPAHTKIIVLKVYCIIMDKPAMEYSKSFPTTSEGYRIELAPKSRLNEVLAFLRENFHAEETMSQSLRGSGAVDITDEESKLIEEDEDKMIIAVYETSPCLIAIHNATDQIVGILLVVLSKRSEEDEGGAASAAIFGSTDLKSRITNLYYTYLSKIDREVGIFDKYPEAQAALEFFIIAVHNEHRRRGLAKDLSMIGINMAKSLPEVGVVFGVYTSIYSKRVAEQIGMKNVMEFDLERDFKNTGGQPVFPHTKPNNIVTVMALKVTLPDEF